MSNSRLFVIGWVVAVIVVIILIFIPFEMDKTVFKRASFNDLAGWHKDKITESLPAFQKSCEKLSGSWLPLCEKIKEFEGSDRELRKLLEEHLVPFKVIAQNGTEGLFTGYYEAELNGSKEKTDKFNIPVYGFPEDMVAVDLKDFGYQVAKPKFFAMVQDGKLKPYGSRSEIEEGVKAPILAWVDDEVDLFILQIQGSGRIKLPDNQYIKVGYAANNEHAFIGIGKIMQDKGLLQKGKAGMPEIKKWLKDNPKVAKQLMRENPRYIFFKINDKDGAVGSLGVPLTPQRSLAVDTEYITLGVPLWLDTTDADGNKIQRLVLDQDTGKAIKGAVRGDFYWGFGEKAFYQAGRMKSGGSYFVFLPKGKKDGAK